MNHQQSDRSTGGLLHQKDSIMKVVKHLTLAVGYGHFGNVLNHQADGVWGLTTKWEF
jgi:hypothetical protein